MQIHVVRNGQNVGQFSVEEVNRKLADGTFSPADLGWHEGAAAWAPLSSIAAVMISAAPAAPVPSPPLPSPTPGAPPMRPIQNRVTSVGPQPAQNYKGMLITSWLMLGVTFVISLIPVLGCGSWFLVWPVSAATLIMAIVILTRGGKTQGIALIVASVLIIPVALVVPVVTTAILGASVSEREKTQEKSIVENLRALSDAKAKWVAQTRVTEGAKVTVAGLALYLDGKEIKSIVGEIYDPRPVGEEPTATLPASKSLAGHKKGAVITVSGSSLSNESETNDDESSPAATPQQL